MKKGTKRRLENVRKKAEQNAANRKLRTEYRRNRGSYIPDTHPDVKKRINLESGKPLKKQIRSAKRKVDSKINKRSRRLTRTQGSA